MKKLCLFLLLFLFACTGGVWAQFDAQLSQYHLAMGYYNPGYAGTSDNLNLFALHRQQWVGIKRAPKSFFVTADMPLTLGKSQHGVGLVFFSESYGLFQVTNMAAQYAYKKALFGGTLSIGAQIGIMNQVFNGDKVYLIDPDTPQNGGAIDGAIPNTVVEGMAFDINLGAYYTHKHFYAGFGVMHVSEPEIALGDNATTFIGRTFNLTGGYNIQTKNPLYELQPAVLVKTDLMNVQADITARLVYNKMFNGGITWRVNESIVALLGVSLGRFQVGYAYDFPTTAIRKESMGSHELMVKYSLKLMKTKTGKNRHKSVRIL